MQHNSYGFFFWEFSRVLEQQHSWHMFNSCSNENQTMAHKQHGIGTGNHHSATNKHKHEKFLDSLRLQLQGIINFIIQTPIMNKQT
jgi:hypothetical protein